MGKQVRLTTVEVVDIINAYSEDLTPMIELANKYGMTRQGVYKVLRRAGIDTTKKRLPVSCTTCGAEILRTKARIRKQLNHFCTPECYFAFLDAGSWGKYIYWRQGMRIARNKVCQYYPVRPKHVVHHEDRNCYNNRLDNLRVFANQGDHVRYHRGFDVLPLWSGENPCP